MLRTARYFCWVALLVSAIGALIGAGVVGYMKQPLQKSPQLSQPFDPMTFTGRSVLTPQGTWQWLSFSMAPGPLDRWVHLTPHVSPAPLTPSAAISPSLTN
jgi:hypothetical protein